MRNFRVNIKGYTKGAKENDYIVQCANFGIAMNRAWKMFRKDFPRVNYDEIIVKVR